MRKPELAAAIAEKADLSKDQANRVLNAVLDEITNALNRKDSVTLVGFGTFVQRHRGARTGKTRRPANRSPSRPAIPSRSNRARCSKTPSTDAAPTGADRLRVNLTDRSSRTRSYPSFPADQATTMRPSSRTGRDNTS